MDAVVVSYICLVVGSGLILFGLLFLLDKALIAAARFSTRLACKARRKEWKIRRRPS